MFKLIIAAIVIIAIGVLVSEWRKYNNKEKAKIKQAKEAAYLREELEGVNSDLRKADVEEDVADAKIALQKRKDEIAAKLAQLDDDDA